MAKDKADIKRMIEELKALDTKRMYLNDFFHTWKESDDEISAVFHVAEILRGLRENNISAALASRSSVTTPQERDSLSLLPAIFSDLRCRISMRRYRRLLMARLSGKLRTWFPSWLM